MAWRQRRLLAALLVRMMAGILLALFMSAPGSLRAHLSSHGNIEKALAHGGSGVIMSGVGQLTVSTPSHLRLRAAARAHVVWRLALQPVGL